MASKTAEENPAPKATQPPFQDQAIKALAWRSGCSEGLFVPIDSHSLITHGSATTQSRSTGPEGQGREMRG